MKHLVLGIFILAVILASLPQNSSAGQQQPPASGTVVAATPTPVISRFH